MAKQVVETYISDISGKPIGDEELWQVNLSPGKDNPRRASYTLDVTEAEIRELLAKGVPVKKRGRPKGSVNKPKAE
jgi:hypothetical protein